MNEPCSIVGCGHERKLNSYFCPLHYEAWMTSPERKRANDLDTANHTLTMLTDFVKRVSAEGR